MRIALLLSILGSLFFACSFQNDRIEVQMMNCHYQAYHDNGERLKSAIKEYEVLLIEEQVLSNTSGKSYIELLQKIVNDDQYKNSPSELFFNKIPSIAEMDLRKLEECQSRIIRESSYDQSKLKRLEKSIGTIDLEDMDMPLMAKAMLDVLSEEDFKLNYYKLRTFLLISVSNIDTRLGIELPDTEVDWRLDDLNNAMNVSINDQNKIFVDSVEVSIKGLEDLVVEYMLENESESSIILNCEKDVLIGTYLDVQNIILDKIDSLRKIAAIEKFNVELDSLNTEKLDQINFIYPRKIKVGVSTKE